MTQSRLFQDRHGLQLQREIITEYKSAHLVVSISVYIIFVCYSILFVTHISGRGKGCGNNACLYH